MIGITPQAIPDILLLEPDRFGDERGWFSETFRASALCEAGFHLPFVQDNHAFTAAKGTLRGLHYQNGAHAQAKLIRAVRGAVLDVAVDIRIGSPWYGRSVVTRLDAEGGAQLLIPPGFAHGYLTLTDDSDVLYKLTAYYAPESEGGLLWCDPALDIDWGIAPEAALVKARDRAWPTLAELDSPFVYEALEG